MNITSILKDRFTHAAAVLAITAASFFFFAVPLQERIRTESDDIQKFYAKVEHNQRKMSKLPELRSQFESVNQNEREVLLLLSETEVVTFVESIESIAADADGTVSIEQGASLSANPKKASPEKSDSGVEVSPAETITEKLPWEKKLLLRVTFFGSYPHAIDFLHKVETMPYRTDVLSFDIKQADQNRSSGSSTGLFSSDDVSAAGKNERLQVTASFDIAVYLR